MPKCVVAVSFRQLRGRLGLYGRPEVNTNGSYRRAGHLRAICPARLYAYCDCLGLHVAVCDSLSQGVRPSSHHLQCEQRGYECHIKEPSCRMQHPSFSVVVKSSKFPTLASFTIPPSGSMHSLVRSTIMVDLVEFTHSQSPWSSIRGPAMLGECRGLSVRTTAVKDNFHITETITQCLSKLLTNGPSSLHMSELIRMPPRFLHANTP